MILFYLFIFVALNVQQLLLICFLINLLKVRFCFDSCRLQKLFLHLKKLRQVFIPFCIKNVLRVIVTTQTEPRKEMRENSWLAIYTSSILCPYRSLGGAYADNQPSSPPTAASPELLVKSQRYSSYFCRRSE